MTIKIYGGPGSPGTGRVLMTLFEKGINRSEIEILHINFEAGEQKSPDHLKRQPFGQVPVLENGNMMLYESRAIARTIAHQYANQGNPLYGSSPKDAALTEQWLEVESQNYNGPITKIIREGIVRQLYNKPIDHAVIDAELLKLESVLDVYEKRLSESKYLAGDFFSLADLSHIPYTFLMIKIGEMRDVFDAHPHVKAWTDDIFLRPSTQNWVELATPRFRLFKKLDRPGDVNHD